MARPCTGAHGRGRDKDGKPSTYWISHKTQLIRCAPHHVRPDFQQIEKTAIDSLDIVRREVSGLKSRGVLNKQDIDDVEEDEQAMDEEPDEAEAKRRRLCDELPDADYYEPSSPHGVPAGPGDVLDQPISENGDLSLPAPVAPPSIVESEPSGEPEPVPASSAPSEVPVPAPFLHLAVVNPLRSSVFALTGKRP